MSVTIHNTMYIRDGPLNISRDTAYNFPKGIAILSLQIDFVSENNTDTDEMQYIMTYFISLHFFANVPGLKRVNIFFENRTLRGSLKVQNILLYFGLYIFSQKEETEYSPKTTVYTSSTRKGYAVRRLSQTA